MSTRNIVRAGDLIDCHQSIARGLRVHQNPQCEIGEHGELHLMLSRLIDLLSLIYMDIPA
jgi:hypothetical protein